MAVVAAAVVVVAAGGGLGTPPTFAKEHFHMIWIVMVHSRFHSPSNTS
jgi:hypothetical protein